MIFLDTNVLSETMRPRPDPGVTAWIVRNGPDLKASTIAFAEIAYGIQRVRASERSPRWAIALDAWRQQLGPNVHPFDDESADIYGRIMGEAKLAGRPIEPVDGMIAATTLRHGAALATRNTAHFRIAGLTLVNPWGV